MTRRKKREFVSLEQRMQDDPGFRELVEKLNEREELQQLAQSVVDLEEDAFQSGEAAGFGHILDGVEAQVAKQGPGILARITQAGAQRQVASAERKTPPRKKGAKL